MDSLVIRRATADDVTQIGDLWEELVRYHVELDSRLPDAVTHGGRRYARRLHEKLDDDYTCILVAEISGELVGYVLGLAVDLVPDLFAQNVSGFLADIYVRQAYRQQGVGRRLVQTLVEWFRERGVQQYEWHVAAHNHEAMAFWKRLGGDPLMIRMRADTDGDAL